MFFSLPQFPASSVGGAATAPAAGSCDYVLGSTAHKLAKDCKRIIMPSIRDRIPTRLRLQRRSEKRAAHQHTHHHLLDPATAQPVATSEDYENLRTRLAFKKDAGDRRWMSMERVAMQGECEDGQDSCREAGEMLAMGRGPWRFAQRSAVRVGEEREEEANWGADVEGWEIVDVREARREMPSEAEFVAARRPWADMKKKVVGRGGKKARAVWV